MQLNYAIQPGAEPLVMFYTTNLLQN